MFKALALASLAALVAMTIVPAYASIDTNGRDGAAATGAPLVCAAVDACEQATPPGAVLSDGRIHFG
jgi:hypothetical protein